MTPWKPFNLLEERSISSRDALQHYLLKFDIMDQGVPRTALGGKLKSSAEIMEKKSPMKLRINEEKEHRIMPFTAHRNCVSVSSRCSSETPFILFEGP
jgi:hypothetical protein